MLPDGPSLEAIAAAFRWKVPARFNIAQACCRRWAEQEPDRVALRQWVPDGEPVETTYRQLDAFSDKLANVLGGLGGVGGDRVAIILPQCMEAAAAHMAIYKSGQIAVPLARLFAADALRFRLARSGARIAITDHEGAKKIASVRHELPDLEHVLCVGSQTGHGSSALEPLMERAPAGFILADTEPTTPALIIFTSGTTGPPKGALHGHQVLLGHLPGVQIHHEFLPQDGDMAWTPADWAWAGGLLNILLPCLYFGVPVVHGGLDRFDAEQAFRLMEEMAVANAFIPPTALRLMKQVPSPASRFHLRLRTVGSGGESLGRDVYAWASDALGVTINEFYGQTECNLVLSSIAALGVSQAGAIGKAVPGHDVAVIDEDGQPCSPGQPGEIAVRRPDPVMFLGYWQDEEATQAKFIGDWMRTGDRCEIGEDGYFRFVGRDDDLINSAGYRVGPGEIEECLVTHPAVKLAVAVGKPDPLRTEIVKAYIVPTPGVTGDQELAETIKRHVKARLAANIYPREIEFVEDIPLTTTGKVIRRVFRERARAEAGGQALS